MSRAVYIVTAVSLAILLLIPLAQSVHTAADSGPLSPLTDLPSYNQWFEQQTGYAHDPVYFGAYALTPISDTLYIGFGAGRPADVDGSLLARSDGVTVTAVSPYVRAICSNPFKWKRSTMLGSHSPCSRE